jgi:hypothetical protein
MNRDIAYTMGRPDGAIRLVMRDTPAELAIGKACERAWKTGRRAVVPEDVDDPAGAAELSRWRDQWGVRTLIDIYGEFKVARR